MTMASETLPAMWGLFLYPIPYYWLTTVGNTATGG